LASWSKINGKRLSQLLSNPRARGVTRDIEIQDSPAVVGDDEEAVQHAECEGRYGEEIHRGDGLAMVVQEGQPAFRWLRVFRGMLHPT
jgi:hypothetical protein